MICFTVPNIIYIFRFNSSFWPVNLTWKSSKTLASASTFLPCAVRVFPFWDKITEGTGDECKQPALRRGLNVLKRHTHTHTHTQARLHTDIHTPPPPPPHTHTPRCSGTNSENKTTASSASFFLEPWAQKACRIRFARTANNTLQLLI